MKSEQIRWPRLADYLAEKGIEWKFIPPSAPHFGGFWKAAVRSFKFHLKRAVGTQHVTYEKLNTLIIGVEAVLNSCPLEPVTSDPDELCVLTPRSKSTGMSLLT
uniref:Integrase catalytic domain-containing protein n=1 Tax=Trichogramma kaykai TaxID=54128 RepID=A0ABD2W978_9HYME